GEGVSGRVERLGGGTGRLEGDRCRDLRCRVTGAAGGAEQGVLVEEVDGQLVGLGDRAVDLPPQRAVQRGGGGEAYRHRGRAPFGRGEVLETLGEHPADPAAV